MKRMMKYLDNVEDMMGGDDMAQIRRMLNYTSGAVKHHSKAYGAIKKEVAEMNQESEQAMGNLSKHSEDIKAMLQEGEKERRKMGTKVAILEEDSDDSGD